MSKERLEEIKKTQYQIIELSKTNMQEDFKYLLSYIDNLEMAFDDLDSDYIDLVKQNKRYREAIEEVLSIENYGVDTDYIKVITNILLDALEE